MLNKYLKILVVSIFIILVAIQANKSFVLDEIDFPIVAHETSQTLKPIYYRGEGSESHLGIYHPTLYINSLALFIKGFGFSEVSVRVFGAICVLLSAYLLLLILRQLIKKNVMAEVLLLGLYLLNPYTIANATLPDIDSTVLPVVVLLFIYLSLRYLLHKKDMSNRVILILSFTFALALWSKLTTPLVLPIFLFFLMVITSKSYKKSLLFSLKIALLGSVFFVLTYLIYCKFLGLSTTYTYHFLIDSFTKGTSTDGPIKGAIKNLENIRHFVYWVTLPIVGLFGVSFIGVMGDKDKNEKTQIKKLLVLMGLLVTVFYIALIAPFGGFFKYPFPVFGILILTVVLFYDQHFKNKKINPLKVVLAILAGFSIEKIFWGDAMFLNAKPFHGLTILLLTIIVSYFILKKLNQSTATNLFVLFILFSIGFQTSISRVQATSPYPTKYLYGQIGMDQTTAYLRSNTSPDEVIWSMKDVGYYVNNRYYESYTYYFDKSRQANLVKLLNDGKVKYYIVTTGIGQDNIDYYSDTKQILDSHAVRDKQFGNFVIYKSKE